MSFQDNKITVFPGWPGYSPDLNPQEHIWPWSEAKVRELEKDNDTFDDFGDKVLEAIIDSIIQLEAIRTGISIVVNRDEVLAELILCDFEPSLSKSASLANANVVNCRTCLNTLQVLDQDLIILEVINGKGHGYRNSEWKTFRNGDDKNNHGSDETFSYGKKSLIGEEVLLF